MRRWLERPGRKPLVVRGARQTGKSTLVRQFADANGLTLHEVNLERQPGLLSTFESMDAARILEELQLVVRKGPIRGARALLFLDEVQAIPEALGALRYLWEAHPELPIVAAGSLLEFALSERRTSVPVGRVAYLFMHPMTFEEFLAAAGDHDLVELLGKWDPKQSFPDVAHQRLLERLRSFLVVGGMPEAVASYHGAGDVEAVREVQDAILETYRDDFPKYVGAKNVELMTRAYDYLRRQVGHKLKYVNVDRDAQARAVRDVVELLFNARVAFAVRRTTAGGLPLGAGLDERVYKSYFLDVGLVARTSSIDWIDAETLRSSQFINNGQLAEQFVAQELWATGPSNRAPELFYWLREGRANNAEVDFLLASSKSIVPIEVKAGKSGTMKSLFQFAKQHGAELAVRFDTNPPSRSRISHEIPSAGAVHLDLLSLPLYFAGQLRRLLGST